MTSIPAGRDLLAHPLTNKGTAFTEAERTRFGLHGLLPPQIGTLDQQLERRLRAMRAIPSDFGRYAFLRDLQDGNEILFHAMLAANVEELLPLVYTPTVGEGCERFSEIWRRPRGLFLSYPNRHRIAEILADPAYDRVKVIVVSDGERILGLGDQGAGGMGIPIGKLALYTACAGIHPAETLPILLDLGTDNAARLDDDIYIGWQHERIRGAEYDDFVEAFIEAVIARWPNVLLQWEDFAGHNAGRLLARYRDRLCTFNDDIQGTAATAVGTLLAAVAQTDIPLSEHKIMLFGAGAAGTGIADLLLRAMVADGSGAADARARIWAVDRDGLITADMADLTETQTRLARDPAEVAGWLTAIPGRIGLMDAVTHVAPTILIGTSGQASTFHEGVVRAMSARTPQPIIFALSNPATHAEAKPADIVKWSDGRALIGTGSPFAAEAGAGTIAQVNNVYIFPGVGLGVLAAGAARVTDGMFMAAARALTAMSPGATTPGAPLLPPISALRTVARDVAVAVAEQAVVEGLATTPANRWHERIEAMMWEPAYPETPGEIAVLAAVQG